MARKYRPKVKQATVQAAGRPASPQPQNAVIVAPTQRGERSVGRVDPTREKTVRRQGAYGSLWGRHRSYLSRLPQATDDLSSELGLDVLDRMMNDPQISASVYSQVYQALAQQLTPRPLYADPKHELYKPAMEMYDFISYCMDFCADSMETLDYGLMQAIEDITVSRLIYGNNAAEWTGEITSFGKLTNKMALKSLKPKHPEVYAFVTDPYGNVPCLACYTGEGEEGLNSITSPIPVHLTSQGVWEADAAHLPSGWELIPIGKFLISTHRPRFGDPRGMSCLRPAYNAWYLLMNLWPDYHKYLLQFASPSIKGILGEKAMSSWDPDTEEETDPLDELYSLLEEFQNSSILALRHGTEVDPIQVMGDGSAFTRAVEMLNHQMIKGIQHSILSSETAHDQTRAASSTHKDVADLAADSIKRGITTPLRNQIWKRLITINFGEKFAHLAPIASLGSIAPEDKIEALKAYAMVGYQITPAQYRGIAAELELDPPTQEEIDTMQKKMDNEAKAADKTAAPFGGSNAPPKAPGQQKPEDKKPAPKEAPTKND